MPIIKRSPLRPYLQKTPLNLPRLKTDTEGKVSQRELDHFSRTISEYARDTDGIDTYEPLARFGASQADLGIDQTQTGIIRVDPWFIHIGFEIIFGTGSSTGSGLFRVTLPTKYPLNEGLFSDRHACGVATLTDDDTGDEYSATIRLTNNNRVLFEENSTGNGVTNTQPFTWTDGDAIHGTIGYFREF